MKNSSFPRLIIGSLFFGLMVCTALEAQTVTKASVSLTMSGQTVKQTTSLETRLLRLISAPGEAEEYEPADIGKKPIPQMDCVEEELTSGTRLFRYTISNPAKEPLLVKLSAQASIPMERFAWWNGYANQISQRFDSESFLTMWFPANAAIGEGKAFLLGLDPGEVYSRVDARLDKKAKKLVLEFPLVLDPGASRTVSVVISTCPARYGARDVVQHYYDLFPKWFAPVAGMHPAVLSTQSTYLFWKPETYEQPVSHDLIRRFSGGAGGWEWCYKPFVRGGDWAITDQWSLGYQNNTKESLEAARTAIRSRFDEAARHGVAAMYYLNVFWAEQSLMKEHFPEVLTNTEYDIPCWGGVALRGLYPWKNRYADLFTDSIHDIAEKYPSTRGIAWDSSFGHNRVGDTVAGVTETVEKSFDEKGVFALTGVGYTHLFDLNRSLSSDGYQRANAVNLKLVAPYFVGVRSDSALYEGTPVEDPRRLIRFELFRARLGTPKALSWHKNLLPSHLKWIDWEKLTAEEGVEAYRQVQEDALFLSYFWGAIPSPGMPTLGIRRTFEAISDLIALNRIGWQPSPRVDCPQPFLIARYGNGLGAKIVVINPEFEAGEAELFFPTAYWDGKVPYLVREDGKPLRQAVTADGVRLALDSPRRSITILQVLGEGTPPNRPVTLIAEADTPAGAPATWQWKVEGELSWPGRFAVPREYETPQLASTPSTSTSEQEIVVTTFTGPSLTLTGQPTITSNKDANGLKEWFGENPAAIIESGAAETAMVASRINAWFAAFTPEGGGIPTVEKKIFFVLQSDQKSQVTIQDDKIILSAATPEALEKVALFFLRQMDLAYPVCGVIPPSSDPEMKRLQLSGRVLEREPQHSFILRPTLAERMRKAFPPLVEQ